MLPWEDGDAPTGGQRCYHGEVTMLPKEHSAREDRRATMLSKVLPWEDGGAPADWRWCCHGEATVLPWEGGGADTEKKRCSHGRAAVLLGAAATQNLAMVVAPATGVIDSGQGLPLSMRDVCRKG